MSRSLRLFRRAAAAGLLALGAARAADETLPRLAYNNPGALADLGVGLWAWPLPMDYNGDGLMDLVVVCTDKPYNGTWFFENSGVVDPQLKLPVFKPAVLIGKSAASVGISYVTGEPVVTATASSAASSMSDAVMMSVGAEMSLVNAIAAPKPLLPAASA